MTDFEILVSSFTERQQKFCNASAIRYENLLNRLSEVGTNTNTPWTVRLEHMNRIQAALSSINKRLHNLIKVFLEQQRAADREKYLKYRK